MIEKSRQQNALRAMQHLCIMARFLSNDRDQSEMAYSILDLMDHLFNLMSSDQDNTQVFLNSLKSSMDSIPSCKEALRLFDEQNNHEP